MGRQQMERKSELTELKKKDENIAEMKAKKHTESRWKIQKVCKEQDRDKWVMKYKWTKHLKIFLEGK